MVIYPAIDLRDGKCVRLLKGDFATTKVYSEDPLQILEDFDRSGSQWVHMVDLDGAKAGKFTQVELISRLVSQSKLNIQVGGGVRCQQDLDILFAAGAKRVVVGSICVSEPTLVSNWLDKYGAEKIVLALDCSLDNNGVPKVRTHGWQEESRLSIYDVLDNYPSAKYILCTDISVDGTLTGPSIALYKQIQLRYPSLSIIASGGVGKLTDISSLKALNLHGVVIGKALYEQQFSLAEALEI